MRLQTTYNNIYKTHQLTDRQVRITTFCTHVAVGRSGGEFAGNLDHSRTVLHIAISSRNYFIPALLLNNDTAYSVGGK